MGLFDSPTPYQGQDYGSLKKQAQSNGQLFVDDTFPANDNSLSPKGNIQGIQWKRPKDICSNPQLFVEGADSGDVSQGELGNCWFVAAASSLAQHKAVWKKVIPDNKEQEWDAEKPENYAGIFHFCFWRYGEWIDIVVDDQLPTRGNKLVFVRSRSENEFWSALLEKAYAKLFGSYESLIGGELAEALEDFTGGVAEPVDLVAGKYHENQEARDELFNVMKKECENKALMAAAIPAKSSEEMEQSIDVGLVKGHAYGITSVKKVALEGTGFFNLFNKDKLAMIRLRNPWGGCEWKGRFSDDDPEWKKIDKASREKIGLTFEEDGEFWMTFDDFCTYFTNTSICRVVNTSFFSIQKTWSEVIMHSEWTTPGRAGGCMNNKETVLSNPQFVFEVAGDEDEVLFDLTQKSTRSETGKLTIGFSVIKVEENRHYRMHRMQSITKSSAYKNSRSIFLRHTLKKGRYVVLATTFAPNETGNLMLRVYTAADSRAKELVADKPKPSSFATMLPCLPCGKAYACVTRIRLIKATGLELQDRTGGADPYCYVRCEGENVRTPVVSDSVNPEWNSSVIFYRRNPVTKPITVEIWNSNPVKDDFMGEHVFQHKGEEDGKRYEVELADKKEGQKKPGHLVVEFISSTNLQLL